MIARPWNFIYPWPVAADSAAPPSSSLPLPRQTTTKYCYWLLLIQHAAYVAVSPPPPRPPATPAPTHAAKTPKIFALRRFADIICQGVIFHHKKKKKKAAQSYEVETPPMEGLVYTILRRGTLHAKKATRNVKSSNKRP